MTESSERKIYFTYVIPKSEEQSISFSLRYSIDNEEQQYPSNFQILESTPNAEYNEMMEVIYSITIAFPVTHLKISMDYGGSNFISNQIELEPNKSKYIFDLKFDEDLNFGELPRTLDLSPKNMVDLYFNVMKRETDKNVKNRTQENIIRDILQYLREKKYIDFDLFVELYFKVYLTESSIELYKMFNLKYICRRKVDKLETRIKLITFGKKKFA